MEKNAYEGLQLERLFTGLNRAECQKAGSLNRAECQKADSLNRAECQKADSFWQYTTQAKLSLLGHLMTGLQFANSSW
jgi:hypothetical protein